MTPRYVPRLSDGQVEQAVAQNFELWSAGRSGADHLAYNHEQLRRAGPEILRYVGLVDDRGSVLASIKRYGLALQVDGAPARAVGIGAVFTRPDRRGEGLAARLIGEVLREAEDHGYAAAFLYSDIAPAYYAELGFVALGDAEHEADAAVLPIEQPLGVRPAGEGELDLLLDLHELAWRASPRVMRPRRSRAVWRYFAWRNHVSGAFILRDGDRDAGYLLATRDDPIRDLPDLAGDSLWVDEWSAPGIDRARVLATVRMLADHAGTRRVRAWLPPDVGGAPFQARARREAFPMIAPLGATTVDSSRAFLGAFDHF